MAEIPQEPEVGYADIIAWFEMKKKLDTLKWQESQLRKKIAAKFFTTPKEGVNAYEMGDGYELVLEHSIERKVDSAQLEAVKKLTVGQARGQLEQLRVAHAQWPDDLNLFEALKVSADALLRYKPELEVKKFKSLTEVPQYFVQMFLDIKPGSPQLKIRPTAETKKALEVAAAPKAPEPLSALPADLQIPSLTGKAPF